MKFKGILKKITDMAKVKKSNIVLPESTDLRILEAASILAINNICKITLIGNEKEIIYIMEENKIEIPKNDFEIIDNLKSNKKESYANELYSLRKHKNMTIERARELMNNSVYFATMMLKARRCRWYGKWRCSFNSRYSKTSITNH